MNELEQLLSNQFEFQKAVNFPIESIKESDRNELSEKYIFKLIEEAIELRKEFPSAMNPWSKTQKFADIGRIQSELSDILLFYLNILLVWKISIPDLMKAVQKKQNLNFGLVKQKKLDILNAEILAIPGYTTGIGSGSVNPKYIFIGQNPGQSITHGYKFWSNQEDGSSKVLLPILERMGILQDCYFTNFVKCTTLNNVEPSDTMKTFWGEFLIKELGILYYNNQNAKIITMGKWTHETYEEILQELPDGKIQHPAYVLRGGSTIEEYEEHVKQKLTSDN